jgi:D-arabinose 1-dehydrogenase-like Zn-dependent alcohol dehydrogenase
MTMKSMPTMKAMVFAQFGPPDVLQLTEVERPVPGPDEVLIRVHAAGICYHDVLSRGGKIPRDRPGVVLGHEIAGELVELGANVPVERLGERVVVYVRLHCGQCRYCLGGRQDLCRRSAVVGEQGGGGYAEFTRVPARNAVRVPDGLDLTVAAMACCPVGTSVRAALGVAQLAPGDVCLITGAGGGLGLHQIQVARSVGAHVIAVTSSERKCDAITRAGADEIIVSPDLKFSAEVWRRTQKQGVDAVLENVATTTFGESLRACAQRAIVVVVGNIGTQPVAIDPGLTIMRRLRIAGSGNATYEDLRRALHLLATERVKPFIDQVLPFAQAAAGHAAMEHRDSIGRVILSGWS